MSAEPKRIRVHPDLEPILEESTIRPIILEAGGTAYRVSADRVVLTADAEDKIISPDDPLLRLIGADVSPNDSDASMNMHRYLADAYDRQSS